MTDYNLAKTNECRLWDAFCGGNSADFSKLLDENAVMVCGGYRCSGFEYAGLIPADGIGSYEMLAFELVAVTNNFYQVHYVVRLTTDKPDLADLSGEFHVTSSWSLKNNEYKLVFNMDSRIFTD